MKKYENLKNYLMQSGEEDICLSYAEINTFLDSDLPQSAYTHSESFWANTKSGHHYAWLSAGYEVEMATDTTKSTNPYVYFVKTN